jgi:hypothetical protein
MSGTRHTSLERVAPYGDVVGRIAGAALLVAGTVLIADA